MKKLWIILAVMCLLTTSVLGAAAVSAASSTMYGDLDGNGSVNNRDLGMLQQYLNDLIGEDKIDLEAADVTHDDKVNNRDLGLLQRFLNDLVDSLDPEQPEEDDNIYNDTELDWT